LLIFIDSGAFPDEHDLRICRSLSGNRILSGMVQGTILTDAHFACDGIQGVLSFHNLPLLEFYLNLQF
jgi:hypothetical protein